MGDFKKIWSGTKGFEGGYQNLKDDVANYCPSKGKPGSQLIGTKYGISAIGMAQYIKRCPTVIEIKNLSHDKAYEIAKKQYWDPIKGDKINSQALAHLIFDITYGGSSGPLHVRESINRIVGSGTVKEFKSFSLSDQEIGLINKLPEKKLFETIVARRKEFYKSNPYGEGLTNRLMKLQAMYLATLVNAAATVKKHWGKTLLIIAGLGALGYGIYYFATKKK